MKTCLPNARRPHGAAARSFSHLFFPLHKSLALVLAGVLCGTALSAQTVPSPTQTDALIIDNGTAGKADPGDRIRYRADVQNTGAAPATNVQLTANPDPRTTLVGGSFRTSPLAAADGYAVTGNVPINVPAASGLLANDFDDNIGGLLATAGTFGTAQGGSITISANGSFNYTPPPGFIGTDTYSYTLNDGNGIGAGVPATDVGVITFTISNLIWFIDNSAPAGDGRRNTPFNSLAAFNGGSATAGDIVYLEHTGTDYTGPLTLANGERLFGEGHTGAANLSGVLNFTLAPHSVALPAINGSRPLINAGANGIVLAQNNTVRGVNVGNTTGADILGSSFGTLTLSEVILSGTGKALDLTTGTANATFGSVTSTSSPSSGLSLTGVAGTIDLGSTTISGSTTQGILVGTTTANVTFGNTSVSAGTDGVSLQNNASGTRSFGTLSISNGSAVGFLHANGGGLTTVSGQTTITNPGGRGIDIQNAASGNGVSFANTTVTQTGGTGVFLNANAGNVTFADLDITPDANQRALHATENTGTITATSGTFSNSGAVGIEITKATGATPLALALTSVSVSGATNGIVLSNTGGSFAINGSGSTNGSGGTIQNITNRGSSFTTATNITLKNITFTNANTADAAPCGAADNSGCNAAVHLNGVTGATLDNIDITTTAQNGINVRETSNLVITGSTVTQTGAGGQTEEGGLYALNLFGTASITNSQFTFPAVRGGVVYNTNKTLNMTISGSEFSDTQTSAVGADGFEMSSFGTSNTTLAITSCTFMRDKTNGVQFITDNTAVGDITVTGCTVDPGAGVGVPFDFSSNGTSTLKYKIQNNPALKGRATSLVNMFAQGNSSMMGRINGNTITSLGGSGSGIRIIAQENTTDHVVEILNNTISGISADAGITMQSRTSGTPRIDATVMNNNVTISGGATYAIVALAGASNDGSNSIVCTRIANNPTTILPPTPPTPAALGNAQLRVQTAAGQLLLQGPGTSVQNYWDSNGNTPTTGNGGVVSGPGIFPAQVTYNAAACATPTN